MESQQRDNKLILLLGIAGLLSGLATICVAYPIGHHHFPFFPGPIFGIVSTSLASYGYVRSLWKILAIMVACATVLCARSIEPSALKVAAGQNVDQVLSQRLLQRRAA